MTPLSEPAQQDIARLFEERVDYLPGRSLDEKANALRRMSYIQFLTDLTRRIRSSVELDFIQVSSYGASTTSSGSVVLVKDITVDVRDRDVYLVEDIVE